MLCKKCLNLFDEFIKYNLLKEIIQKSCLILKGKEYFYRL